MGEEKGPKRKEVYRENFNLEHPSPAIIPSLFKSPQDLEKTCEKVDIPPEYLNTFLEEGKDIEKELWKSYKKNKREWQKSPFDKFLEGVDYLGSSLKERLNRIPFVSFYRDEALERLKKQWPPENYIIASTLESGEEFDERIDDYESLFDCYETSETKAVIPVGLKDDVRDEDVAQILPQKEVKEAIERHRDRPSTSALIVGSLSRNKDSEELRSRINTLEKFYETAVEDYEMDVDVIGETVPRMVNEMMSWEREIEDKKVKNFSKNVNNTKGVIKRMDACISQCPDKNYNKSMSHMANLYTYPLDPVDRKVLWKAILPHGKREEVIIEATKKYEDQNGLEKGQWLDIDDKFYKGRNV